MPAVQDHQRRDAYAALYAEIKLELDKHRRRLLEDAKARADTRLAEAAAAGERIDGTSIGREAASSALDQYLGPDVPDAIESASAEAVAQLAPAEGS